jgi:large subunit ribosomal protein L24
LQNEQCYHQPFCGQTGRIVEKPAAIHISNVMLLDPETKKATRVGRKTVDGSIVRFAKASGTILK